MALQLHVTIISLDGIENCQHYKNRHFTYKI